MLSHCNIKKDVILIGVGNFIELWNPDIYNKNLIKDSKEIFSSCPKIFRCIKNYEISCSCIT